MCGIFGILCAGEERIDRDYARTLILSLMRLSETRGREAAGIVVHNGTRIEVYKQASSISAFLRSPDFQDILSRTLDGYEARRTGVGGHALAILGHARLVTNGTQTNDDNNQPIITHGSVIIHNGIVVNDRALAVRQPDMVLKSEVDSEVVAALLRTRLDDSGDLVTAARETFAAIEGSASIAMFFDHVECLLLATNTGSLFQLTNPRGTLFAFASERFILQQLADSPGFTAKVGSCEIQQIKAGAARIIHLRDLTRHDFSLQSGDSEARINGVFSPRSTHVEIVDHNPRTLQMQRCTRCILPANYPFVDFDSAGVCAYCRHWKKIVPRGQEALLRELEPYRSKDGSPDVILAFSGGRDSSYGLHYLKRELGMNPVAFTYDWGMVTDLARRNQARLCGKLGIEHIVRSADIATKRRHVRKNIEAWLKRPELGMVTLFTAGDKEFYAHARKIRQETGIKLVVFCTGNMIEDVPYKTGLCGIREDDHGNTLTGMSRRNKLALLWYYAKNYLLNPAYLNESIWDTLNAYRQTFLIKDDFLYLFQYIPWHEDDIFGTIRREYDWELASDTKTSWRIGDATAPFYNYIYRTMAGFTEDQVMLSNMVREGHINREEAELRNLEFDKPRWPSMREYAQIVGFNLDDALQVINAATKRGVNRRSLRSLGSPASYDEPIAPFKQSP